MDIVKMLEINQAVRDVNNKGVFMKIIITGGTGLIGSALAENLAKDGHEVILLSRKPLKGKSVAEGIRLEGWDGHTAQGWGHLVEGADAIVNLAGENLSAGRWTVQRKQAIIESRTNAGAAVVQAVQQAVKKPRVVIQISGVGAYGSSETELIQENTDFGNDFLAGVCRVWEASTQPVEAFGVRRVVTRFGIVLSTKSGALPRMLLPYKLLVGGPLGSGSQWMSWVHLEDAVRVLRFFIETSSVRGVFNVSGEPLTNRQFSRETGMAMRRPAFFTVPAFIIRLLLGEMGIVVLGGQSVSSKRLQEFGFDFYFPNARAALKDLLTH
jgi:uncharacterized protein (TIGR01777 family)